MKTTDPIKKKKKKSHHGLCMGSSKSFSNTTRYQNYEWDPLPKSPKSHPLRLWKNGRKKGRRPLLVSNSISSLSFSLPYIISSINLWPNTYIKIYIRAFFLPVFKRFETSHVLGSLLASSPLLTQAWTRCMRANAGGSSFTFERCGDTVYVAFSGVQPGVPVTNSPVPIGTGGHGLFSPLVGGEGDDNKPVLVHAAILHVFLALYHTNEFQVRATLHFSIIRSGFIYFLLLIFNGVHQEWQPNPIPFLLTAFLFDFKSYFT